MAANLGEPWLRVPGGGDFGARRVPRHHDQRDRWPRNSFLSLKTADGWTRTITADSSTPITKGGQTIALGDLKVGDQVAFRSVEGSRRVVHDHHDPGRPARRRRTGERERGQWRHHQGDRTQVRLAPSTLALVDHIQRQRHRQRNAVWTMRSAFVRGGRGQSCEPGWLARRNRRPCRPARRRPRRRLGRPQIPIGPDGQNNLGANPSATPSTNFKAPADLRSPAHPTRRGRLRARAAFSILTSFSGSGGLIQAGRISRDRHTCSETWMPGSDHNPSADEIQPVESDEAQPSAPPSPPPTSPVTSPESNDPGAAERGAEAGSHR